MYTFEMIQISQKNKNFLKFTCKALIWDIQLNQIKQKIFQHNKSNLKFRPYSLFKYYICQYRISLAFTKTKKFFQEKIIQMKILKFSQFNSKFQMDQIIIQNKLPNKLSNQLPLTIFANSYENDNRRYKK
ncbi:unnamed protein product [Paramecium sonneborni]|uniref:Uncharacterized protein n=1 Tax=Paramecium sonneborni TaxID=65129 RepID=A0A8S1JSU0_9CILI|nr:unnamed protein product [Paramecium sonneborni]